MSLLIIKLTPAEILTLKEEKILPKDPRLVLRKGQNYGFYHHHYLYGIYRLKGENSRFYFLKKNRYRPLRFFTSRTAQKSFISQPEWVETVWQSRNHLHDHLLLKSDEDDASYSFQFYHHLFPGFEKTLTIKKTPEMVSVIQQVKDLLLTKDNLPLTEIRRVGSRLFQLGGFAEISEFASHRITYSSAYSSFPLEVLYDPIQEEFFWLENPIIHCHPLTPRRRKLHSFICIDTGEDPTMEAEREAVKKSFKNKKYFSSQFLTSTRKETLLAEMGADFLHLICHGEEREGEFVFIHQGQPFLTLSDISNLPKTPAVVFLSNCYSDHSALGEVFFNRGTQTLITSRGPLFPSPLPDALRGFYHRLLYEKTTVLESYHLLIKKLISLNDINAVKLRIHGYGKERLFSFKG